MNSNKMPSQRQIRYGELIRSIISECLIKEDFFDSPLDISTITISFVNMSKDLRIASVYFMPLGGILKEDVLKYLNDKKYIFQRCADQRFDLYFNHFCFINVYIFNYKQ